MKQTLLLLSLLYGTLIADTIITTNGDEIAGTITGLTQDEVHYVPENGSDTLTLSGGDVFMVKYDNGEKVVFGQKREKRKERTDIDSRWSASLLAKTGFFGLINVDERYFDAGIVTYGVSPSVDFRINRIFSVGMEYMLLWVQPNTDNEARFVMNCNALGKLTFPLNDRFSFHTLLGAGISMWPAGEDTLEAEPSFYEDRFGWDVQLDLGFGYRPRSRTTFLFRAGYTASFSTRDEVPVTMDGLMLSFGPQLSF